MRNRGRLFEAIIYHNRMIGECVSLSAPGPHLFRFKRSYLQPAKKNSKKASSVTHEYSNESLDSHSGLATALASAIFGEKNCSKWLDFSIALSPQGRGLQTSLLH